MVGHLCLQSEQISKVKDCRMVDHLYLYNINNVNPLDVKLIFAKLL